MSQKEFEEKIRIYKTAIEMHISEGRYQIKSDLNDVFKEIEKDIENNPSEKYISKLYALKNEILKIQNKKSQA